MTVYLDWNATSPLHPGVRRVMLETAELGWANPSSVHSAGRQAKKVVEDVRELIASRFRLSPRDLVFTGGGTEANHLALNGVRLLVTSRIEHPSIAAQAESFLPTGARVRFVPVTPQGVVEPVVIRCALEELGASGGLAERPNRTSSGLSNSSSPLVAVMAVNHETGVIQPIEEISEAVHALGARLHVDAVQLIGKADPSALEHADSFSVAAHKLRGPKGIGVLAYRCGWTPRPLCRGGGQERGLRPGTVDATLIAGFGAAIERLDQLELAYSKVRELRDEFEKTLLKSAPVGTEIHGSGAARVDHVSNFRVPGWRGDELVAALDLEGICVSSGSACSAGSSESSTIIAAMLGRQAATGAVRISFGEDSTEAELKALLTALNHLGVLSFVNGTTGTRVSR